MDKIPESQDKIKALYSYIESNLSNHEGDFWHYILDPTIVTYINNLSKTDCENLIYGVYNWDEEALVSLADPFLKISNPNLDGYYLYCKIFLEIIDIENEEYLIQNIQIVNAVKKGSQPMKFYLDMENKIIAVNEKLDGRYKYAVDQIKLKINFEIS